MEDKEIKRWYLNTARGSQITADICLRRLDGFCNTTNTTPKRLLRLDNKKLHDLLMDLVGKMEEEVAAGSYVQSIIKVVNSWLSYNGRNLSRKIKIKGVYDTPTLKDERVPTSDELRRIFLSGSLQECVACVLVAHSGFRPQILGNYTCSGWFACGRLQGNGN